MVPAGIERDRLTAASRRTDLLAEAARARRLGEARPATGACPSWIAATQTWLGARLVAAGEHQQGIDRAGAGSIATAPCSTSTLS